jgi:hypothetical protein
MTHALSDAFVNTLRDRRADLNERFERARHQYPQLEGDDVIAFLRDCVDGVVAAVQRVDSSAVMSLVSSAYDAALALCGQKLVGGNGRFPIIEEGWKRVLTAAAPVVARDPARMIAAVSNALHALAVTPTARPEEWITSLAHLGPRCNDTESFLRIGQVVAWRSGLAHLRASALAVAELLPPDIAAAAVCGRDGGDWQTIRTRLSGDVWFDPSTTNEPVRGPRVVREIGAFRGLGGLFLLPPRIAAADGGWLVHSAEQHWYLTVDTFGATFHRATAEEWSAANLEPRLPDGVTLTGSTLTQRSFTLTLPVVGPVTSAAASGFTLAITSAHTHSLTFITLN